MCRALMLKFSEQFLAVSLSLMIFELEVLLNEGESVPACSAAPEARGPGLFSHLL